MLLWVLFGLPGWVYTGSILFIYGMWFFFKFIFYKDIKIEEPEFTEVIKVVEIDDKFYICREVTKEDNVTVTWLTCYAHREGNFFIDRLPSLELKQSCFKSFLTSGNIERGSHIEIFPRAGYLGSHNLFGKEFNRLLAISIAEYWTGQQYYKYLEIRKKQEAEEKLKAEKALEKALNGKVIWSSYKPKEEKPLQLTYREEVLRLTPLIIKAHEEENTLQEANYIAELEDLMIQNKR
jgi:hypothetical protein